MQLNPLFLTTLSLIYSSFWNSSDAFQSFLRCETYFSRSALTFITPISPRSPISRVILFDSTERVDQSDDDPKKVEVITLNDDNDDLANEEDQEWISDRDLIRRATAAPGGEVLTNRNKDTLEKMRSAESNPVQEQKNANDPSNDKTQDLLDPKKSVYTEEEEELINAMGGKDQSSSSETKTSTREPGYLGDSTLSEIAMDFSVPICYIADVLVTWGCPIPIDPNAVLGDLVTGEQAFALLEAIHTLDISALHDRYSDDDIISVADEYEIELKEAFDFAVKEGWSLPFGVRTHLRVEQEFELIRALADDIIIGD